MLHQYPESRIANGGNIRAVTLGIGLMVLLLVAVTRNQPGAVMTGVDENVSALELTDETNEVLGKTVTMRGKIAEKVGNNAFTLRDDQLLDGQKILAINASNQPFELPADSEIEVQVMGEVRNFHRADIEREFNLDLQSDQSNYREYENKTAIIGQSLTLAPDPAEITENPSQFYNQPLAIRGKVSKIISSNVFMIDDEEVVGDRDLLVVSPVSPTLNEGDKVVVNGKLRPFVAAEFQRDYDLTWDLDLQRQLETNYFDRPTLIAESSFPSVE
ncbi:MAG TPA: hypothetical protein DDZ80_00140 [Cyanobacteria bacterium UBA8803]|nr:hypothetical protein [Cyanobacteria bacterium UBA9273]HBL57026.1 hypothetical protein [Cyanobacteria bacterium UBA8803]